MLTLRLEGLRSSAGWWPRTDAPLLLLLHRRVQQLTAVQQQERRAAR
ncbi:hypothetical protein [Streptomyces sp. NPDC092129]